jgi:hypothetical protein
VAKYKILYPGLNESLKHLRVQVIHSLPYIVKHTPRFNTPEQIFNYCKERYTYKNDPNGVELFQTVHTLLTDNEHGRPGEGDCDDATIFCLSMLLINGFDCGIVLTGRNKNNPTHIYAYALHNGERQILDLTNKKFNTIRPYPFKQYIPFKISKQQLDMFLQLADRPGNRFKSIKTKKPRLRKLTEAEKEQGVFIPSKNVFIPIDKFDKLPIKKAKYTLLSENYDLEQVSEYLSGRAERKAKKKEKAATRKERRDIKTEKKRTKVEMKKAKVEVKQAKAQKKRDTGEAKKTRAYAKQVKAERREPGQGMKIFDKAGQLVKTFVNREEQEPQEEEEENIFAPDQEEQNFNPEEIEQAEEIEQTDETELEEGLKELNKYDLVNAGLFALGLFLEKTKKVA